MASPGEIIDLAQLFKNQFGSKPYVINKKGDISDDPGELYKIGSSKSADQEFTPKGSLILEKVLGIDIFLPIRLFDNGSLLMHLPYCVLRISSKKTVIKTPLAERKGTVKEFYNIDDYSISIKGFLIDSNRQFPEQLLVDFRTLYETKTAVTIDNAITNIFLTDPELKQDEQRRVVVMDFDLPEVQGGRKHVRPFTMQLESDSVFTLELEEDV